MEERKTFWILLEEYADPNIQGKTKITYLKRMGAGSYLKNAPLFFNTMEEALKEFESFDKKFWERRKKELPTDPMTRFNKPWKNYVAQVKNLPNSKWLNENFINKHIVLVKEIQYEVPPQPLPILPSTADGYLPETTDGYPDGYLF